ncbi:unnamed protein product [marine sediment metagenome]|uniref:Uncharacterized protein n=1 Tax=marine sediment metagenome TaxID=412755 RepID=X0ZFA2_9ZZZZ
MLEARVDNSSVEKKLTETAYRSHNFNVIPPVIGIIISDQYGNTITVFEYDSNDDDDYCPIRSYLSKDHNNLLEIDLVSMYLSSFKIFAGQANIKNLSHLEIYGSNIKAQIYFLLEKFMVIMFLNSNTDLNSKQRAQVIKYCEDKLVKYESEFENFNNTSSRETLSLLEQKGKRWLKKFNIRYIQTYKNIYLRKHETTEELMAQLGLIIQSEIEEYLNYVPDDIINNFSKELKNKIQDKLFEINLNASENIKKRII